MLKFIALLWALWRYNTKNALFAYIRKHVPDQPDKSRDSFMEIYERLEDDFKYIFRQSGAPYMSHLHAVVVILVVHMEIRDMNAILGGLFHDVLEEVSLVWSVERIREMYNDVLAEYVVALTKSDGVGDAYHRTFMVLEWVIGAIKLADRFHNVLTLFYCSVEKQQRKIAETIVFYLPVSIGRDILHPEIHYAIKFAQCMAAIASMWQVVMLKTKPRAV